MQCKTCVRTGMAEINLQREALAHSLTQTTDQLQTKQPGRDSDGSITQESENTTDFLFLFLH